MMKQALSSAPFLLATIVHLSLLPLCICMGDVCSPAETTSRNLTWAENYGVDDGNTGEIEIHNFWEEEFEGINMNDHLIAIVQHANFNIFTNYFSLEDGNAEGSGILFTKGWIDREVIALDLFNPYRAVKFDFDVLVFKVISSGISVISCVNVTIHVADLDDNSPTFHFNSETEAIVFNEDNTATGERRELPIALDNDEGENGTSLYELSDPSEKFELVYLNYPGTPRVQFLFLINTSPLDYEEQSAYVLQLYAREGVVPYDSASIDIHVTITDLCDEEPMFTTSRYTPSISEDADILSFIASVEATDADNNTTCPLQYTINKVCARADEQANCQTITSEPFVLDSESGQLTLNEELDREDFVEYEITIQATDGVESSATAMVVISIDDINDNYPVITYQILPSIAEDQAVNPSQAIGHVGVTDADAGRNGQVSVCLLDNSTGSIEISQTFQLFQTLNQRDYQIILSRPLDFETQRQFHLIIRAEDNGTEPLSTNRAVLINITDHNDHAPQFVNLSTDVSIREDSGMNTLVTTVHAIDLDTGRNAEIRYELPESNTTYPHQNLFTIEEEIGEILVGEGAVLDYEEFTSYTILVVARNSESTIPLASSVEITIELENINDRVPQITLPEDPFEVNETASVGDTVGRVVVTDADNLEPLSYSLTNHNSLFSISGDGTISLEGSLDFETTQSYLVTLEVFDGEYTASAEVMISVLPVNDERPTFDNVGRYIADVREELDAGVFVVTVTASDRDIPPQNLQFSIPQGTHRERFSIDASGDIHTTQQLDREDTANYTLWVQVSDGELTSENLKEVFIMVTDINDHRPEFIGLPYNFEIEERNAEYQDVGQVMVLSLDDGDNHAVRFQFSEDTNTNGWFSIDEITGVIETNGHVLDRETNLSPLQLSVEVRDLGTPSLMSSAAVTVTVLDTNDNGPVFPASTYTFSLREDYPIGQVFDSVVAHDSDGVGNNATLYSFSEETRDDASQFHIDESTGALSLVASLDFETRDRTTFIVAATDAGSRDRQTFTTVVINITNARDLNLTLPGDFSPHYAIYENIEANYTIASFMITDTMNNSVDRLIYSLTTLEDTLSPYFGIRKEGYLAIIYTRTHSINREAADLGNDKTYKLKLNVSDPDTTEDSYGYIVSYLTVEILDENDNAPMFLPSMGGFEFTVMENGDAGEIVVELEVVDPDEGNNGTIQFNIVDSGMPFNVTRVEQNDGRQFAVLRVIQPLDRETRSSYLFFIRAADLGTPTSLDTTKQVTVHVGDENDNPPVICEVPCVFEVPENLNLQQIVAEIRASDPDAGTNGEIRFEVAPGNLIDSQFALNPNNGEILLIESLDRETEAQHEFRVRAVDGGNLAATAMVIITVLDINEYGPEFINSSFTVTIEEDSTTGVPFTSLIAVDQDASSNAVVEYALADNSLSKIFCLDQQTGAISICNPSSGSCIFSEVIDYERQNEYKVGIIAYDQGEPRRYSNKTLTVQITNVNEHIPTFDVSELEILLSENLEVGDSVLEIQAYDRDSNEELQYNLVYQVPGTYFHWDNEEKALILDRQLDYNDDPFLLIELRVTDAAEHSHNVRISILVVNENNHSPVFETQSSTIVVTETTTIASEVFTVHATDADNATNDAVLYSISSGNTDDAFYLNSKTGVLYVAQDLDYETQPTYSLTIVATDTGEPSMVSDPVYIVVQILDENDEAPIFVESEYTFNLEENNLEMSEVDCVRAQDRDLGDYGVVVYSIIDEGEYQGFFSINEGDGCISTLQTIDRERNSEFLLVVQAQDQENPSKLDTATVAISIGDANDNAPEFSQSLFLFYISPTHDASSVGTISASDSDSGINSLFSYEIAMQDPNLDVSLASESGVVSLATAIPSAYQASYSVGVRASSTVVGDTRYDDATVMIIVESENDHHPRFTEQVYEQRVSENADLGNSIFDASEVVTDEDGTTQLSYELVGSYEQFALDMDTGLLTLQEVLNYEEIDSYEIKIRVVDTFTELTRTATATVRVLVEDVNDHAPRFIDSEVPTEIILSRIPYTNVELFTVVAEDEDVGDQGTVGYSIVEDSSNMFEIDPETGVVTNRVNLLRDGTYSFVIRAFDHGSPLMSSNITVYVEIHDPENPPQFVNGDATIEIHLPEDKNIQTSPNIQEFETEPVAESYHIVYSNASKNMFGISPENNLVLKSKLDYETASQYMLIIEARSLNNGLRLSSFLLVNIIVTDVNDNEPQFTTIQNQEFSESHPTETELLVVEATDNDSGTNADITYAISGGNIGNTFWIDPTSGSVRLVQSLDREATSSYDLVIRASDGGQPDHMQNEMIVHIEVVDVNDNAPTFSQGNYTISVFEYPHTVVGDSIIQIVAEDLDTSFPVSYHLELLQGTLKGVERDPSSDTFRIDFDTGNITTHRSLDREEIDQYLLKIEARDNIDVHTAVTYLTVNVNDVNDHSPMFTQAEREVTVYEMLPVNWLVLDRQQVTDRDIGPNGLVKYYLGDNWPAGDFKIDPWTGAIRVARKFAFIPDPMLNEFDGTLLAVDQGVPARTATMTVKVRIRDVNDYPPVLDNTHFSLGISVSHPLNTPITKFNYTDEEDNGFNTATMIRIPNYYTDANDLFYMSISGTLELSRPATSDDIGEHEFRIEGFQQSSSPFCPQYIQASYAHVTVTVYPDNSYAPQFIRPQTTVEVEEDELPGTVLDVTDFRAIDNDGDSVFYRILSPSNLPFAILDPSKPEITTTGALDADSVSTATYTVTVQARDDGFPARSSNTTLIILVKDVNDLPPEFEEDMYLGWVAENSPAETSVLTVSATDPDRVVSSSISYTIEDCDLNCPPFAIRSSGDIVTTGEIDYEIVESYFFRVAASDGSFTSYVPVTIDVSGENDHPPVFITKRYEFTVKEEQPDGSLVGKVEAEDRDAGMEGQLRYTFVSEIETEYNIFSLNETSGEIFLDLGKILDVVVTRRKRDVNTSGETVIISTIIDARDSGENSESDTTEVIISVDKIIFERIGATEPADTEDGLLEIIIIVVIAVSVAIVIFSAIIVLALIFRRRSKNKKFKLEDGKRTGRGSMEMATERYCRNGNVNSSSNGQPSTTRLQTGNSGSGSERSYTGTADDEMDSGNEGHRHFAGHSPNLLSKPLRNGSPRIRSTSDLASSVGTDALHSQTNEHPYTKAQLMRIYAANEELLDDNVSHDSVHMFGSEGGGEADGDLDINNLIFQKINDLEDDEESTTIMDDDASTTYSKGRGTVLAGSAGNLDITEGREDMLSYPDVIKGGWIPPTGRPMDETIDEITATSSFASQEEPLPRRHGYELSGYSHSQGPSLYNPSATQESFIGIRPPPKLYHNDPKRMTHDYRYYAEEHDDDRLPREHEQERPRYVPRSNHRYGSASVLPANPDYMQGHRQHYRSQELAPPYSKFSPFIPGGRRQMGHPHTYMTPTEGTDDGTVTPQTALTQEYPYLSSSSTSLTSTNVSGNLSQPTRRPQMYN